MGTAAETGAAVGQAGSAVSQARRRRWWGRRHAQGHPRHRPSADARKPPRRRRRLVRVGVLMASIFPASEQEKQAADQLSDKASR